MCGESESLKLYFLHTFLLVLFQFSKCIVAHLGITWLESYSCTVPVIIISPIISP